MDNMLPKAQYLALMMKKLIEGINDPSKLDNRDYYGNKRMKSSGTLIELLFEDLFKSYNSQLKTLLNK
jgi:DNA-directed RNA polymerase III subunit RPC2